MFELRDRAMAEKIISKIKGLDQKIRIMHVCGTHQDTLVKHGLIDMLADVGVEVRQGPGCPVCVTTPQEIEEMREMTDAKPEISDVRPREGAISLRIPLPPNGVNYIVLRSPEAPAATKEWSIYQ